MSLLAPATEAEKAAFWRMLAAYLVEHAAIVDPAGDFDPLEFPTFDLYWRESFRHPWWIGGDDAPAGLALVSDRYSPSGRGADHGLVEFFIAPEHRRRGLGRRAAAELFAAAPGVWELSVGRANAGGLAFWPTAIAEAAPIEAETIVEETRVIHRFRVG